MLRPSGPYAADGSILGSTLSLFNKSSLLKLRAEPQAGLSVFRAAARRPRFSAFTLTQKRESSSRECSPNSLLLYSLRTWMLGFFSLEVPSCLLTSIEHFFVCIQHTFDIKKTKLQRTMTFCLSQLLHTATKCRFLFQFQDSENVHFIQNSKNVHFDLIFVTYETN